MVYLCYVQESTNFQQIYQWIDKWCHNHKVFPVIIGGESTNTRFAPWRFPTYDDARNSPELKDASWVYLDLDGEVTLDEFEHPQGDTVYALGSDYSGFDNHVRDGIIVTVEGGQQYAAVIAPSVLYDRYIKGKIK